jgi:hypothetical protein
VLPFASPLRLAIAAIRNFCPSQLSEPGRTFDGQAKAFEDQYQKELYRCLLPLLDGAILVSPEYVVKGGGRVDFQLEGKQWAIELTREGTRASLDEHCRRFLPKGKYHGMARSGGIRTFTVLNFTTSLPEEPLPGVFSSHCS